MILDLERFVAAGRPRWNELEALVGRLERDPGFRLDLGGARRLHLLYQQASADLARLRSFSAEPALRGYLESLVGRAYAEIHETRARAARLRPLHWLGRTFPRTVRRHALALAVSAGATLAGVAFGAGALAVDPEAKAALIPFGHLAGDPRDRVAGEERAARGEGDPLGGGKLAFSSFLMTHNTKVSMTAMALGATFGIGTLLVLFSNGVMLGAVCLDYLRAGEGTFLAGWLLPHGSFEIPAILIAGQAGLVLGAALVGRGAREGVKGRLRRVGPDLVTLVGGVAVMLVWAGIVEAFLSQYHEPVVPYAAKIGFGAAELALLVLFLWRSGAGETEAERGAGAGGGEARS